MPSGASGIAGFIELPQSRAMFAATDRQISRIACLGAENPLQFRSPCIVGILERL
jgi:hypothetical protein